MAEDVVIIEQMKVIAAMEGKTLTDIYAEAARKYLKSKKVKK